MKSFNKKIFVAGSGGQGVLFLGKLLYLTAVRNGYNAMYFPSYGAEVRGGTTKCLLTVSTGRIATPLFTKADEAIILNPLSLMKYKSWIQTCSSIIVFQNKKGKLRPLNKDQNIYTFSCNEVPSFENVRSTALYSHFAEWFTDKDILHCLAFVLKEKSPALLEKNKQVFSESFNEAQADI